MSRLLLRGALCLLCCAWLACAGDTTESLWAPLRRVALSPRATSALHARRRTLLDGAGSLNASALLPLYGSVRDNGVFTVHLQLGTPPQPFDLIVDTGSTLAYVPCRDCGASCGTHEVCVKREMCVRVGQL
jgi:hypothetical protein